MLRQLIVGFAAMSLVALAGCESGGHGMKATASGTAAPSMTGGSSNPADDVIPASRGHNDGIQTSLSPLEAASVAGTLFQKMNFNVASYPASYPYAADVRLPVKGDQFSAIAHATTLQGAAMDVVCQWMSPGVTHVQFQSDLPLDRHAYVLQEITKELHAAAANAKKGN